MGEVAIDNMLSVLILSKNEEDVIEECLKSVKGFADEIIVVDSYSTDKTVELAEKLGAKVIQNKFDDFSSQRNFALLKAKGDWIFYLDADERLTEEFKKEAKEVVNNFKEDGIGGYFVKRKTFFLGRDWGMSDKVQRLFYKKFFKGWEGVVHETPKIEGKFGEISSPILHFTHRNLSQMLEKTNEWSEYEAQLRLRVHHPKMNIFRFIRVMLTGFVQSYIKEKGYKNGTEGLIESIYQSFSMFITYAKLWEKQR